MVPSENTFAALLSIEGAQWHYHIPRFQREYIWGKNNWSKLLEDIYENEPGHYMGSIICVHDTDPLSPGQEHIYEVVDGQQRLTTLSIMLCAIYSKLNNEVLKSKSSLKEDDEFIIKCNNIKQRLLKKIEVKDHKVPWGIQKTGPIYYYLRVQPSTQENNLIDYQYILSEAGLLPDITNPKNCGNRRLHRAYTYFLKNIPDDFNGLKDLLERIYNLSFIHISETSQSKAFLLFETLNYRGVPLSAIDIIKNKMLAALEIKHKQEIDVSYEEWQNLLSYLPEDTEQDRFLRQFYNAFKHNSDIKIEKITKATASTIITIYESLIKKDAKMIFQQLTEKAKIYNQLIEPDKYPVSTLNNGLVDLERIGAAASYTLLLYLFSLENNCYDEKDFKEKIVDLLCKYYFRRNITDFPNTRDLDAINIELIEQCQKTIIDGKKISYSFISKKLFAGKGKPSDVKTFRGSLSDNLFYNNEGMTRYALAKINETYHSREYAPDLWARNEKGLFIWTIEHVFPQGKNIPSGWITMIARGNKEEAGKIQDEWVHCLGNLTLSGYNSRLSNQPFKKKQKKVGANIFGNKIYIGYKNGMALNNITFDVHEKRYSLANAPEWRKEYIEARNTVMVDKLIKIYKLEID
jgi:uncharacterized protein with ParB-like and HNH nuclease domain